MIHDSERREVARRLRGIDFSDVLFDSELVDAIEYVCGSKRKRRDFVKIVDRLADLIEPAPSCEFWDAEEQECYSVHTVRTCRNDSKPPTGFCCSACGWGDFCEPTHLLTTACFAGGGGLNYCPNCGAKVVDE